MDDVKAFCEQVMQSRALSHEQKELLTADPEKLPASYRAEVLHILASFDKQSKEREQYLREEVIARTAAFEKKLNDEGIDEETKQALMKKATTLTESLFPVKNAV